MRKTLLICTTLLWAALPAGAATTQADADKVKADLKAQYGEYFEVFKIAPEGDGYHITLDTAALAAAAAKQGSKFDLSPFDFSLLPEGKNWKIAHKSNLSLNIETVTPEKLSLQEKVENFTVSGLYDGALGLLAKAAIDGGKVTFSEHVTDPAKGVDLEFNGEVASFHEELASTPAGDGNADVKLGGTLGAMVFNVLTGDRAGQAVPVRATSSGGTFEGNLTGLRTQAFLPLWRFAVAHPNKAALVKDQDKLKSLLLDALPVAKTIYENFTLAKVTVQSPAGTVGFDKLGVVVKANGLTKDGRLEEGFSFEGLVLPPKMAPAWAAPLVPKSATVNYAIAGLDLDGLVRSSVAAMDLSKDKPLSDEDSQKIGAMLMANGGANIALGKSSISNAIYNLTAEGSVSLPTAGGKPSGKFHITMTGIDAVKDAIAASPPEAGLQKQVGVIALVKGLGKMQADGSMSWDVEISGDGKVTVNGTDLKNLR